MQTMVWLMIRFVFGAKEWLVEEKETKIIMYCLIIEHIFALLLGVFRQWEIRKSGKFDQDGVLRGKYESMLKTVEIFFDCILVGFTIKHFFFLGWDGF